MNKPNIHHFSMNNELFRSSDADASDAMNNSCIHRKNDEYSVIIIWNMMNNDYVVWICN